MCGSKDTEKVEIEHVPRTFTHPDVLCAGAEQQGS